MNRLRNTKIKDVENNDLFSMLERHVEQMMINDMEKMYEKKVKKMHSKTPWIFELAQ